jgi:hypothetical protein
MRASITGLAVFVSILLGIAEPGSAAPIPGYFSQSNPSAICTTVDSTPILVQVNFDTATEGGIDLATADSLFSRLPSVVPGLQSILGPGAQVTCSFSPSEAREIFDMNALEFAQGLSPVFRDIGFAAYVIVDVFKWVEPEHLGSVPSVRSDIFLVEGANDATYVFSVTVPRALIGL